MAGKKLTPKISNSNQWIRTILQNHSIKLKCLRIES